MQLQLDNLSSKPLNTDNLGRVIGVVTLLNGVFMGTYLKPEERIRVMVGLIRLTEMLMRQDKSLKKHLLLKQGLVLVQSRLNRVFESQKEHLGVGYEKQLQSLVEDD